MNHFKIVVLIIAIQIRLDHARIYNCDTASLCGCSSVSSNSVNQRIVGGEIVQNRVWGWIVSLQFYDRHRCGASLINSEFAITAAHCVDDLMSLTSSVSILAGTNDLTDTSGRNSQRRTIKNIYLHPKYDDINTDNDIAIIQFSSLRVNNSSTLSFICLPQSKIDPFVDEDELVAAGWGFTSEGAGVASSVLRQVTVRAMPSNHVSCINAPIRDPQIKFCAGLDEGGKDTCQGDSGGPLMAFQNNQWILAGITSSGRGCARPRSPGLYTRVSTFIPFVKSILNQYSTTKYTSTTTTTKQITTKITTNSGTEPVSITTSGINISPDDNSSDFPSSAAVLENTQEDSKKI